MAKRQLYFLTARQQENEIIKVCKKWLSTPYGFHKHEWAYQKIKRKIIIEKLLHDSSGKTPDDYKFCSLSWEMSFNISYL